MKKSFVIFNFFISAAVTIVLATASAQARQVYLNGKDISGARKQKLQKVDVDIDDSGNVYIQGSQYQVQVVDQYAPLRQQAPTPGVPAHHQAASVPSLDAVPPTVAPATEVPSVANEAPVETPKMTEKQGTKPAMGH